MSWLQFIASIIGSLAWPAVILIFLWMARNQVGPLFARMNELHLPGGAKAIFSKQLEEGSKVIEAVEFAKSGAKPIGPVRTGDSGPTATTWSRFAKRYPQISVDGAYREVEQLLDEIRPRLDELKDIPTAAGTIETLTHLGLLDHSMLELFYSLMTGHSAALHTRAQDLTPDEAAEYVKQASVLQGALREILNKISPQKQG
jgi:hypothetical protein